jgi:hypothetical protein
MRDFNAMGGLLGGGSIARLFARTRARGRSMDRPVSDRADRAAKAPTRWFARSEYRSVLLHVTFFVGEGEDARGGRDATRAAKALRCVGSTFDPALVLTTSTF